MVVAGDPKWRCHRGQSRARAGRDPPSARFIGAGGPKMAAAAWPIPLT